ncbi:universal stress protein [Nonomuraea pusilla]|uniref:universal stress protein n=1 Tax=Nonomuraea pusilla TaxID=46177 RepID=UPI00331F35C2
MSRPIVVGLDGSESSYEALDWAVDDAVRRGLSVRLAHVRQPWQAERSGIAASDHQTLTERCEAMLATGTERARRRVPELRVESALITGALVERMREESRAADSMVLGSRGLGGFAGLVLGSCGLALAGHALCPVVIVRRPEHPGGEVVAGFDGSPDAEAGLEFALEQAAARGVPLRVLYSQPSPVVAPHPVGYGPIPVGPPVKEIWQRLAPWREKYADVEVAESLVTGQPATALSHASRRASLVVVGSRGLGGFASAVLGSVSHAVLQRARCPVAVVHSPWNRA